MEFRTTVWLVRFPGAHSTRCGAILRGGALAESRARSKITCSPDRRNAAGPVYGPGPEGGPGTSGFRRNALRSETAGAGFERFGRRRDAPFGRKRSTVAGTLDYSRVIAFWFFDFTRRTMAVRKIPKNNHRLKILRLSST